MGKMLGCLLVALIFLGFTIIGFLPFIMDVLILFTDATAYSLYQSWWGWSILIWLTLWVTAVAGAPFLILLFYMTLKMKDTSFTIRSIILIGGILFLSPVVLAMKIVVASFTMGSMEAALSVPFNSTATAFILIAPLFLSILSLPFRLLAR